MTFSLDVMIQYMKKEHPEVRLAVRKEPGSILCDNRNRIVKKGRLIKATHLLFIDSDMAFDKDALVRLLKHDRDVVSGLCTIKNPPYSPVALRRNEGGAWAKVDPNELVEGRFFSDLEGVGCAFTLIKMGVFDELEEPWFAMPPMFMVDSYRSVIKAEKGLRDALKELVCQDEKVPPDVLEKLLTAYEWKPVDHGKHSGAVMGEDIYFCDKVRHAGIEVCLDTSIVIGHIGEHVCCIDDYVQYKKQREEEAAEKAESAA